jgi:alpha-tubulin suppressor-like RCC1 family protein/plastocyanin
MAEPKVQLVAPLGNITVPGMNVTGVVTATLGDVGVAGSIIQGNNIDIGAGIITATSFVGNQIGTYRAASLTGSPDLVVGVVTSSGFVAQITGDVTGNLTGNVVGTAGSILSGNNVRAGIATVAGMSGDGSNLTGIAATSYNTQTVPGSTYSINVTNDGSSAYTLSGTDRNGSVSGNNASVSVEIGDTLNFVVDASGHPFYIRVSDGGANVSTPAATNQGAQSGTVSWTPNTAGTYYYQCGNHAGMIGTITVTATTTIDLSAGNMITFNQSANTTISFANTSTAMDITIIRIKDSTATARTITWPDSISWDGGTAPTLVDSNPSGEESDQIQLLTRDEGLTWYGWLPFSNNRVDQNLFVSGYNDFGKFGQNSATPDRYSSPIQISGTNWRNGQMSDWGVLATKTDNTLWVWGGNQQGGLGNNKQYLAISSPTQITGSWSFGAAGNNNRSYAINTDGELWIWGKNEYGALGLNQSAPGLAGKSSPTQLGTDTNWSSAGDYAYYRNSWGIKTDGTLWVWGSNDNTRLGTNDSISNRHQSSPVQIGGTTWKAMSGSYASGLSTKTDGTLWAWGYNAYGQLGQNNRTEYSSPRQIPGSWNKIASGSYSNYATKTDGTLWGWGCSINGELGLNEHFSPSYSGRSSPVQIPGTTWETVINLGNKAAGATKSDGTFWSWGSNTYGQLGLNDKTQRSSPTQVPGTTWDTEAVIKPCPSSNGGSHFILRKVQ